METADIESKVIAFITEKVHLEKPVEIKATTTFKDLSLDSLDVVQLLFEAEDAFGISFDMEKATDITCIGDIAAYIAKHQARAAT
ncbi:MAG: acyl carrier protein [Gammaproteobacteria bacterium]|nr:acyl carrier protein [Gammaproteobacteria bacterium]